VSALFAGLMVQETARSVQFQPMAGRAGDEVGLTISFIISSLTAGKGLGTVAHSRLSA